MEALCLARRYRSQSSAVVTHFGNAAFRWLGLGKILRFRWLLLVLGLRILAAGPLAVTASDRGGTLRLAFECRTLDPARMFLHHEATLGRMVFNNLLDLDDTGTLIPDLAEALPEVSPDGRSYTFHLRRNVHFSSGEELVADDVVFSLERFFDPRTASPTAVYMKGIVGGRAFQEAREAEMAGQRPTGAGERWIEPTRLAGVEALNRHTVRVTLEQPDLMFLQILTGPMAGIVPRSAVRRSSTVFGRHPVGTGPFLLESWDQDLRMRFRANPRHFRPELPRLARVDVDVIKDFSTQAIMFERGELDLVTDVMDPDYFRLIRDPDIRPRFRVVQGAMSIYCALNCELAPFTNRLVRVAMNHAVDRARLVHALLNRGVAARGVLPVALRGFNPHLPEYAYDPARARALLSEAGLPNGFETVLLFPREGPAWNKAAQILQQNLRDIGVRMELREASYGAVMELSQRRRTSPMTLFDVVPTVNDPKDPLDLLLNGDHITDEACQNAAFYSSDPVQRLFRAATVEIEPGHRLRRYQEIEEAIIREAPWIFLCHLNYEILCQPWVKGFTPRGFWPPARLEKCWIER